MKKKFLLLLPLIMFHDCFSACGCSKVNNRRKAKRSSSKSQNIQRSRGRDGQQGRNVSTKGGLTKDICGLKICSCLLAQKERERNKRENDRRYQAASITTHEAQKLDDSYIFVSVLPEEYYAKWYIAGSINVSLDIIADVAKDWDKNKNILLYCFTDRKSRIAYDQLIPLGFTNLKMMSGGIKKWIEDGYPAQGTGTYREMKDVIRQILAALEH